MSNEPNLLRRIAWTEVCPWLMLVRCVRLAISPTILFLAASGLLILLLGDMAAQRFFESDVMKVTSRVGSRSDSHLRISVTKDDLCPYPWGRLGENVARVYFSFFHPIAGLFNRSLSTSEFLVQLCLVTWRLAVWSLCGGAITRIAVVYLGRDLRLSLFDSLRHAGRNFGWYLGAPLFPLLGVALLLVPMALLGLVMRFDLGALIAAVVWPFALLGALGMSVLVIAVLVGGPLMWPTMSAEEGSDSFEAFSRSFAFTYQRPLHYLFYAIVAVILGGLGWLFVANVGNAVILLTDWGISFGAGNRRLNEIAAGATEGNGLVTASAVLIATWNWLVQIIIEAFSYGFFFCAASAIYLLLRRDLDQTDFDEVFLSDRAGRFGLASHQLSTDGEAASE